MGDRWLRKPSERRTGRPERDLRQIIFRKVDIWKERIWKLMSLKLFIPAYPTESLCVFSGRGIPIWKPLLNSRGWQTSIYPPPFLWIKLHCTQPHSLVHVLPTATAFTPPRQSSVWAMTLCLTRPETFTCWYSGEQLCYLLSTALCMCFLRFFSLNQNYIHNLWGQIVLQILLWKIVLSPPKQLLYMFSLDVYGYGTGQTRESQKLLTAIKETAPDRSTISK